MIDYIIIGLLIIGLFFLIIKKLFKFIFFLAIILIIYIIINGMPDLSQLTNLLFE